MTEDDTGLFRFPAKLSRVVDGDTQYLDVDLGFSIFFREESFRLDGVDTSEIFGVKKESEEYKSGIEHKEFVEEWYAEAEEEWDGEWPLILDTKKADNKGKYGRYIADVIRRSDGHSLVDDLLDEFEGIEYEY